MFKLFYLIKKCAGEARWSGYKTWREKLEIFKILFRLRYRSEIKKDERGPVTQYIFGFKVNAPSYRELLYLFREIFLALEYNFEFKNPIPSILDCGANIGMSILFFKKRYPRARIVAFEPNPRIFELLQKNILENNIRDVELIQAGLSDREGEVDFHFDHSNSLVGSINKNRGGVEKTRVPVKKLSSFMGGEKFDLVKMDVEGAEGHVMSDLNQTGAIRQVNQFMLEYHHNIKDLPTTLSGFLRIFEENGFTYNLKSTFNKPGEVQDIVITCNRNV